jgi:hypothetical protein
MTKKRQKFESIIISGKKNMFLIWKIFDRNKSTNHYSCFDINIK